MTAKTLVMEPTTVSVSVGDTDITFETGRLAKQAGGAVYVTSGGTAVLATATGAAKPRPGTDFFPLTVDVEERSYAAGKIPGGFFRREGRSGEKAILTARMIDRPMRPLFPKNFRNDVHCIATVVSADLENAYDVLAINGISAALMVSQLPFFGPVGAVRVGLIDGELVINPAMPLMLESKLDLIVCGTEEAITMVEAGAKIVDEDTLVEALDLAHKAIKQICAAQNELVAKVGKFKWTTQDVIADFRSRYADRIRDVVKSDGLAAAARFVDETLVDDAAPAITIQSAQGDIEQRTRAELTLSIILAEVQLAETKAAIESQFGDALREFSDFEQDSKELKAAKQSILRDRILAEIKLPFPTGNEDGSFDETTSSTIKAAFGAAYKALVRHKITVEKVRPDGREQTEIRDIRTEVDVTPRTHGSGLFTRGETQILTVLTLGTTKEEQRIDDLSLESNRYYMHHYNFPPFSVGETGFMRGPKRRDIGHGALAERALVPVLPDLDAFPYTIRLVSETLESNGSSSQGSICGSTLALMDGGVPIKAPVAGIAMGLIKEGDDYVILTDIQGAEDHLGDMDFKVAGTDEGVTALQMDIKITGVTTELLRSALMQAKDARLSILDKMAETIAEPREEINENAPSIQVVKIDSDQIGMVIGKGGETIRGLEEEYTVSISIGEDGTVQIYGVNKQSAIDAAEAIESMTKEIEVGEEFDGTVVKLAEFGAFVELKRGTDGLLHVSRMGPDRVENVGDVVNVGDTVGVKVVEVDSVRGRIALTLIRDPQGNPVEQRPERPKGDRDGDRGPRSGGDRGGRGGDRGGNRGGGNRGGQGGGGNRGRGGNGGGGGGQRSRGGQGGGGGQRSEGGNRSEGGQRSEGGGNRDRNRSRGGNGGGERQGGDRPARESAPKPKAEAPAPAESKPEGGRRFKFRLRGGDDS
jgi:polyribonucleotide nucleotidyltransferase